MRKCLVRLFFTIIIVLAGLLGCSRAEPDSTVAIKQKKTFSFTMPARYMMHAQYVILDTIHLEHETYYVSVYENELKSDKFSWQCVAGYIIIIRYTGEDRRELTPGKIVSAYSDHDILTSVVDTTTYSYIDATEVLLHCWIQPHREPNYPPVRTYIQHQKEEIADIISHDIITAEAP